MALTSEGAWYPTLPDSPPFGVSSWGEVRTGSGAPDANSGNLGDVYVDVTNNLFYVYGDAGWTVLTGGGAGGSGAVGVVDPEGVVTATAGTPYFNTANASFWYKTSGSGNTGWTQLI